MWWVRKREDSKKTEVHSRKMDWMVSLLAMRTTETFAVEEYNTFSFGPVKSKTSMGQSNGDTE